MNCSDAHRLSLQGFRRDSKEWAAESTDHLSLSKYSIYHLLQTAIYYDIDTLGEALELFLLAAALKREHVGASLFIFWSFANKPQKQDIELIGYGQNFECVDLNNKESLHGLGAPTGELFKVWRANKKSGNNLVAPTWGLPFLSDYADEFLHLSNHLKSLSREFNALFLGSRVNMAEILDTDFYFNQEHSLIQLATKTLKYAVAEHSVNPADLFAQDFEEIGLATRMTQNVKDEATKLNLSIDNLIEGLESGE